MAKKKRVIKVTYTFDVEYEYEEHLRNMKRDLLKGPLVDTFGAGVATGGKFGSFGCKMRKKGVIEKEG